MRERKSFVLTLRLDLRTYATIHLFLKDNGEEVENTKSTSMVKALMYFERLVVSKNPQYEFSTYEDAIKYLEDEGIFSLSKDFHGKRNILSALQDECLLIEGYDPAEIAKMRIRRSKRPDKSLEFERAQMDLEKRLGPEVIINEESLEDSAERRLEEEKKMKEDLRKTAETKTET